MDQNGEDAQELAHRAGTQAKHAAKNTGRAVKAAAEPAIEGIAEEIGDTAEKLEDTAQEALRAARKVNVGVLGRMSSDAGVGFLALSVAIYSGTVAYAKFRQAASGGPRIVG